MRFDRVIILHDIRSAYNVGAIFRTADGAGVSKIHICGYTPAPIDRFGREQDEILKTSLGATKTVKWESCEDTEVLVTRVKDEGYTVVSVEQSPTSISYTSYKLKGNTAFVFGNEREGVPEHILESSDTVLHLPMLGMKESLNVSVAVGIVMYQFLP